MAWDYVGSVFGYLGRVLEATWGRFANFLHPLELILGSLGELWNVSEGLVCLLTVFWGLLEEVLEDLGTS